MQLIFLLPERGGIAGSETTRLPRPFTPQKSFPIFRFPDFPVLRPACPFAYQLFTLMRVPSQEVRPVFGVFLLSLIYAAYISLGLPDGIMGTAWPELRATFKVPLNANWPIYALGLAGGLISSLSTGALLKRSSIGRILLATTVLTSVSIAACAASPWFLLIPVFSFFLGLGNGAIDCALNHFAATHLSSRHMNWLHGFWGIGVSSGTLIVSGVFALGGSWRTACLCVALLQALLAVVFSLVLDRWRQTPVEPGSTPDAAPPAPASHATLRETLRVPSAWLSMLAFLLYCGIEFGTGVWTTSLLQDSRGWAPERAALWATGFWVSLTLGRFLVGLVSNRFKAIDLLKLSISGVMIGTGLISLSSLLRHTPYANALTGGGLLLIGLCLAPIYPTMMHDTPRCAGPAHAANLVGLQAAAASIGLALIPGALGTLMKYSSLERLGFMLFALAASLLLTVMLKERLKRSQ
jgi:fucose permease